MKTAKFLTLSIITLVVIFMTSCKKEKENNRKETGTIIVNTTVLGYGAIAGVNVSIEDDNGNDIDQKITNSNGQVTFKDLLSGTYTVRAWYVPNQNEEHIGHKTVQLASRKTKTIILELD